VKISDSPGKPLSGLARSGKVAPARGNVAGGSAAATPPATDRVQLSNLSAHLSAALGESASHLKRLSSLAEAVLTRGYHVDASGVSDSIIRETLQFGGANYI
jgi:hypothetical protein